MNTESPQVGTHRAGILEGIFPLFGEMLENVRFMNSREFKTLSKITILFCK